MLTILAATASATAAHTAWEEMEQRPAADITIERPEGDTIEISVKDGYVYITTTKPVTVKIFSILGQLITQKTIPAGTSRTHIAARGIYILKTDTTTRRITI